MLAVTINKQKCNIPTGWHEVTWVQYLQLIEPKKLTQILSIFTGISEKKLLKAKIQGLEKILMALNFTKDGMDIPEYPTTLGKFKLPKDITLESVDQYFILQKEIEKSAAQESLIERTKYLANFAAIYCMSEQEFDYDKCLELAKSFDGYSCIEVLAAGSFFLHRLTSIEKNLPMSYLLTLTRWKNLRPALKSSRKRLGITPRSTRSRGMYKKTMKK